MAQTVRNLPAMQEAWVQSLGWEDHLEKEMTTLSSIFAQRIPWTEEPGGPQSMGLQRVRYNWAQRRYQRDTFVINWYDLKFDKVVNLVPHEWKGKKNRQNKKICFFGWNSLGLEKNIERNIFQSLSEYFLKYSVTSCFRRGGIEENVACT